MSKSQCLFIPINSLANSYHCCIIATQAPSHFQQLSIVEVEEKIFSKTFHQNLTNARENERYSSISKIFKLFLNNDNSFILQRMTQG